MKKKLKRLPAKKHRIESRSRQISETYCVEPGCKFRGKRAEQGICHTTTTFGGSSDWSYTDDVIKQASEHVSKILKRYKGQELLRYLAAEVETGWANSIFTLDELIRLRRRDTLLREQMRRLQAKQRRKR